MDNIPEYQWNLGEVWDPLTEDPNTYLPLNSVANDDAAHLAGPKSEELAALQNKVDQLSVIVSEVNEKLSTLFSELQTVVKNWKTDMRSSMVDMSKDIASLDRNYLRSVQWCHDIHQAVTDLSSKVDGRAKKGGSA